MIQLTKEHLHEQNKKLTEENQRLDLLICSLHRQLQNSAALIEKSYKLEDQVDALMKELNNLRRDNLQLQELIEEYQSKEKCIINETDNVTKQNEAENIKVQYEEKLKVIMTENKRLARIVKEYHNNQKSSLEEQALKLIEISNKIDQKLSDQGQSHKRMLSNPTYQSPKGISKEIYDSLIHQLANSSMDEKSILTDQIKSKLQESQKFNKSQYQQQQMTIMQGTTSLPSLRKVVKK